MGCIYYSSTNHWITSMNYNETSSVVDILRETKKHQCKVVAVSGLKKHVLAVFVWCSSTLRFGRCWGSSAPQWGRKKITPSSKSLPQYHSLVILISNLLVCFSDGLSCSCTAGISTRFSTFAWKALRFSPSWVELPPGDKKMTKLFESLDHFSTKVKSTHFFIWWKLYLSAVCKPNMHLKSVYTFQFSSKVLVDIPPKYVQNRPIGHTHLLMIFVWLNRGFFTAPVEVHVLEPAWWFLPGTSQVASVELQSRKMMNPGSKKYVQNPGKSTL